MGESGRHELEFWGRKIVNDENLQPRMLKTKTGEVLVTYCNLAIHRLCRALGYDRFDGMRANGIIEVCRKEWEIARGGDQDRFNLAQQSANEGNLVILGYSDEPHGHVAMGFPGEMSFSGRWKLNCPMVANVGKENKICSANYAFDTSRPPPEVFIRERNRN